jgi:hypothetical protein
MTAAMSDDETTRTLAMRSEARAQRGETYDADPDKDGALRR